MSSSDLLAAPEAVSDSVSSSGSAAAAAKPAVPAIMAVLSSKAVATGNQISSWTAQWGSNKEAEDDEAHRIRVDQMKAESSSMLTELNDAIHDICDFIGKVHDELSEESESAKNGSLKIVLREDCKPLLHFCQCLDKRRNRKKDKKKKTETTTTSTYHCTFLPIAL